VARREVGRLAGLRIDTRLPFACEKRLWCESRLPGGQSEASDEPCAQVADDVTVQVGHHENVKEARVLDKLQNGGKGQL
jgi:hypothetical protein